MLENYQTNGGSGLEEEPQSDTARRMKGAMKS